jgi:hypothetical protein
LPFGWPAAARVHERLRARPGGPPLKRGNYRTHCALHGDRICRRWPRCPKAPNIICWPSPAMLATFGRPIILASVEPVAERRRSLIDTGRNCLVPCRLGQRMFTQRLTLSCMHAEDTLINAAHQGGEFGGFRAKPASGRNFWSVQCSAETLKRS